IRERVEVGEPFEALIDGASDEPVNEPISSDDLAMLMFTSGTTGRSKGVMLTHSNVTWNAVNVLSVVDLRHDDVTIAIAPFFRVGGNGVHVMQVVFLGGCVVVPEHTDPGSLLEELERHRVTVGFANPDLLDRLRRSPALASADLGSLRLIVTGGAPVPERLIAE